MDEGNTLVNALVGAVVTAVTSFLPLSPVIGGAVAGYLQGGTRSDGLRVGAISGFIGMIPVLAVGFLLFSVLGVFALGIESAFPFAIGGFLIVFALVSSLVYFVGLSAVGGWIGNYVKYDTDIDL